MPSQNGMGVLEVVVAAALCKHTCTHTHCRHRRGFKAVPLLCILSHPAPSNHGRPEHTDFSTGNTRSSRPVLTTRVRQDTFRNISGTPPLVSRLVPSTVYRHGYLVRQTTFVFICDSAKQLLQQRRGIQPSKQQQQLQYCFIKSRTRCLRTLTG